MVVLMFSDDALERLKKKLEDKELTIKVEGIGKYLIEFAVIASASAFGFALGTVLGKVFSNAKVITKAKKILQILTS